MGKRDDDYFRISDSHNLNCYIRKYNNHILVIDVLNQDNQHIHTITFTSVGYLKCPSKWRGAHFRLGTTEECAELWSSLSPKLSLDKFYEYQSLFVIEGVDRGKESPFIVHILAENGKLHDYPQR